MGRIVTLDIETGINGGELAYGPAPDVVAIGWHNQNAPGIYSTSYGSHESHRGQLARLLHGTSVLIGFNIKFDIEHLINFREDYDAWQDWVASGGILWDCQLAEYLIRGMHPDSHYLSLNEVSAHYGGEQKLDAIAELWAAGVDTRDIDKDLLLEYLRGDVRNTRMIFEKQIAIARERKQTKSLLLNFGALCCSVEMERNGVFVDEPLSETLRNELLEEIGALHTELQGFIPLELRRHFNWGSRFHKSALLFGGEVKYPQREYLRKDGTWTFDGVGSPSDSYAYAQRTDRHFLLESGETADPDFYNAVRHGPVAVFKAGKNAGERRYKNVTSDDFTKPKSRMGEIVVKLPGHTEPLEEWKSSPEGVYKVGEEVMTALKASSIPFVKALVRYTAASKDLGTYFYTEESDGSRKGMLTTVGPDGIIHHSINHVSVVTGRLSVSKPNLQNLPRKDKSVVKKMFRSRFNKTVEGRVKHGKIGQADFSSLEIYVQGILTGAKALLKALREGMDVHVLNLSVSTLGEGKSYEELLRLCKGWTDEAGHYHAVLPEWKEKRVKAKEISFQDAYGAGDVKIAKTTGIPQEEVHAFRQAGKDTNPEIEAYFTSLGEALVKNRVPNGPATPHPDVPGLMCNLGRSHFTTPDGKRYGFEERPTPASMIRNRPAQGFSPTEIKNYVVQGTGGEIAKAAMWLSVREFYRRRNFAGRALLINQVHDALYVDAADEVAETACIVLHGCMLAATQFYAEWNGWDIPITIPVETTFGDDLSDETPVKLPREIEIQAFVLEQVALGQKLA